jgi:hypothetical protein
MPAFLILLRRVTHPFSLEGMDAKCPFSFIGEDAIGIHQQPLCLSCLYELY